MPFIRFSTRGLLIASLVISAAPVAVAASFPTVVRAVLDGQNDGRLASLDPGTRAEMTDCVVATLVGLPGGKKRYITEGASLDQQTDRFGEVVQEDRAKWKQKIASACGSIALNKSKGNR